MTLIYEASIYSQTVSYRNFKGEEKTETLTFALDPLLLMQHISAIPSPRKSKSGNPARANDYEFSDSDQLKFVRTLAVASAGWPSNDGDSWEPFEDFEDSLAGKAFLTKLISSDGDRKNFAEKVILDPFRAFIAYAKADESNSSKDIKNFDEMMAQMEKLFSGEPDKEETIEERKARLKAELALVETGE